MIIYETPAKPLQPEELKYEMFEDEHYLRVLVTREPFSDTFELRLPNGHSESFTSEETINWFVERGADKHKLESTLDYIWNFYSGEILVKKTGVSASPAVDAITPKI